MTGKKTIIVSVLFLLCVTFLILCYPQIKRSEQNNSSIVSTQDDQKKANPVNFFETEPFLQGVKKAQIQGQSAKNPNISGLIIPHHLYPSQLLSEAFQKLDPNSIERIFLIGPNHYNQGDYPVLTAKNNWQTEFGIVAADNENITTLTKEGYAVLADEILVKEHSVAGIYPYIKYYLPNVKVIPLVIKKDISKDQIDQLALILSALISPKTIVVAAVDFSHNLTAETADSRDVVTLAAIRENNLDKLSSLNDEYLDSPESIILLLKIMNKININNQQVLGHTNSGILKKDYTTPVTSYFSLVFTK